MYKDVCICQGEKIKAYKKEKEKVSYFRTKKGKNDPVANCWKNFNLL